MQRALSTHLLVNHRLTTICLERIWDAGIPLVEIFCARQHLDYHNRAQIAENHLIKTVNFGTKALEVFCLAACCDRGVEELPAEKKGEARLVSPTPSKHCYVLPRRIAWASSFVSLLGGRVE